MDDRKLIDELRRRGLGNGTSLGHHSGICDAAADRIEELTARLTESERQRAAAVETLTKMANAHKDCGGCACIGDSIDKCEYQHTGDCYEYEEATHGKD